MKVKNNKILIVLPNLGGGGAEKIHVNLANEWADKGYQVEFILLQKKGELIKLLSESIKIVDLNVKRIRNSIIPLSIYIKKERPLLILAAMWPLNSAVVASKILSGYSCKLFISEHENLTNSYLQQNRVSSFILRNMIRVTYGFATGIIAVSEGVKNDLCELGKLNHKKVKVIHNPAATGLNYNKLNKLDRDYLWGDEIEFRILSVGRLSRQKNHKLLIDAFFILSKKIKNAKLIILGDGPLKGELERIVISLQLEKKVEFHGYVINPYQWFCSADIFVLSSDWEGFGNVIVEALECGLPVVSTNCPDGPAEILENGRFGKLVQVGNTEQLVKGILEYRENKYDRNALVNRAKEFTVEKISKKYLDYFEIPYCI